jgi:hypothetical protein
MSCVLINNPLCRVPAIRVFVTVFDLVHILTIHTHKEESDLLTYTSLCETLTALPSGSNLMDRANSPVLLSPLLCMRHLIATSRGKDWKKIQGPKPSPSIQVNICVKTYSQRLRAFGLDKLHKILFDYKVPLWYQSGSILRVSTYNNRVWSVEDGECETWVCQIL